MGTNVMTFFYKKLWAYANKLVGIQEKWTNWYIASRALLWSDVIRINTTVS